jgi:hypothetical protein
VKRAVSIQVQAIDKDYGFTIITPRDAFSGDKLPYITLYEEHGYLHIEYDATALVKVVTR